MLDCDEQLKEHLLRSETLKKAFAKVCTTKLVDDETVYRYDLEAAIKFLDSKLVNQDDETYALIFDELPSSLAHIWLERHDRKVQDLLSRN